MLDEAMRKKNVFDFLVYRNTEKNKITQYIASWNLHNVETKYCMYYKCKYTPSAY